MYKWERNIIEFCEKHLCDIFIVIVTLLALIARITMINFKSDDYLIFLSNWFDFLKTNGFKALATYKGDYNPPYVTIIAILAYLPIEKIYIIKGISIIFDFLLAISIGKLTSYLSKDNKKDIFTLGYSICLFIPSVLLNGALWGQCDSMYAFFIVLSLTYLLKEEYLKSFLMFGLSFSFKLQAVFILPLYVIYYVCKKRYSILYFFVIPIVDLVLCIPAMLVGRSWKACVATYFLQTTEYKGNLVMNFLNIYNFFKGGAEYLYPTAVIVALVICGLTLFYCVIKKPKFDNEQIFTLGIWFLIVMTFILPGMHDRYLYVGEVLAIIYLLIYKRNYKIMSFVVLSPIVTYSYYLFENTLTQEFILILVIIYLFFIIDFTIYTFKLLSGYNR